MKVFFITESGYKTGYGHLTRCISISEAFEEKRVEPFFILNSDEKTEPLPESKPHYIFNWLLEKDKLFPLIENADIAIIDSYLASKELYYEISKKVKLPVYLDDNMRLEYPEGVIINGTIFAEEFNYKNELCLLGSRYTPLRKAFKNIQKKEISEEVKNIMITLGGSDDLNLTPAILKILNQDFSYLTKNVIIGSGFTNIEEVKSSTDNNTHLIYSPNAQKMKKIMLSSDIAVSASGQTLYELAAAGTPTIAIKTADNQGNNIKGCLKAGFIEYAEKIDDIPQKIDLFRDKNIRQQRSSTGKKYIDGQGAKRIVDFLLNALVN